MDVRKLIAMGVLGGGNKNPIIKTDDFARSDGAVGNNWSGTTWTIASGAVVNTPSLGNELLANGNFETWTTDTNAGSWEETVGGSTTFNKEATTKHGGDYAARIDYDSVPTSGYFSQAMSAASAKSFISIDTWIKLPSTKKQYIYIDGEHGVQMPSHTGDGNLNNLKFTLRTGVTNKTLKVTNDNVKSDSAYYDDFSAKQLVTSELMLTRPIYPTSDYILSVDLTAITQNTMAGIVFGLDSPSNPQNYALAVCNGRTVGGSVKWQLFKVVAGVMTLVSTLNTTIGYSAPDTMRVVKSGSSVRVFANEILLGATQTISDAAIVNGLYAGIFSTDPSNTFDNWYEKVKAVGGSTSFLDPFFSDVNIFAIGDSTTAGTGDEDSCGAAVTQLVNSGIATTDQYWAEIPARYATGGYTVANTKAGIDAALAARSTTPTHILIELGANDVAAMPTESDYKTNYRYILDALHAKWTNAKIYIAGAFRQSKLAELTTLNGWNAALIAEHPDYIFAGVDFYPLFIAHPEYINTYHLPDLPYGDGVHPNHAGYVAKAALWKTLLGY